MTSISELDAIARQYGFSCRYNEPGDNFELWNMRPTPRFIEMYDSIFELANIIILITGQTVPSMNK